MKIGTPFYKTATILIALYGIVFWVGYFWQRPGHDEYNSIAFFLLPAGMIVLALGIAIAAIKTAPRWILGFSLFAFFAVGYYFISGNSWWFSSVGYSYLIIIAVSLGWSRYQAGR